MRITMTVLATVLATATAASAMKATDFDIDTDGFVTISELRQIFPGFSSNDFRNLDGNRDNRLAANELNASGVSAILGRYKDTMAVIHGLSDIDSDGDNFASFGELSSVYEGLSENEFRLIDQNKDNRIGASELYKPNAQAMLNRYEMSGRDLVTIMQVDVDDDSFASFAELQAFFPSLSMSEFNIIDINGDNRIGSTEYYNADTQAVLDKN